MGIEDDPFGKGVKAGVEMTAGDFGPIVLGFLKGLAPDLLAYLERKRADRRHVFDVGFAAAETHEERSEITLAFLDDGGGADLTEMVAGAAKKAQDLS